MIYLKRVINQDIERTPTFSIESVKVFFNIFLNNGEYLSKLIKLLSKNLVFDVKFQKRETRDEYRIFLKDLFYEINANEGDILIFRKISDLEFSCEQIILQSSSYIFYNNFFKIGSNHQLVFSDNTLAESFSKSGLYFSQKLIRRFLASLCSKQFLILTGLSGSGKTKIAQSFAKWIVQSKEQYLLVSVGADWTNREPLLGYPNSLEPQKYVTPESGVLQIITNSIQNPEKPYFLILDEMNLSHVERYFADFLSAMESKESINLYTDSVRYTKFDNDNKPIEDSKILDNFKLPANLFIIGTVNIDETTYMFSPKVLDRANTIEFRLTEQDLDIFFQRSIPLNLANLHEDGNEEMFGLGFYHTKSFMKLVDNSNLNIDYSTLSDILLTFFSNLKIAGAEFGYRSINEIAKLVRNLQFFGSDLDEAIDFAVMQKLLPKLHGSRSKMVRVLPLLADSCIDEVNAKALLGEYVKGGDVFVKYKDKITYPVSLEKICRMYKNALDNGFTSYAEA